jgi:hypothetical protein
LPWVSPGRGARVVVEIDSLIVGSCASSALTSVDLPAPDGATTMNRLPANDLDELMCIFRKRGGRPKASPKDVFYQEQRQDSNLQ